MPLEQSSLTLNLDSFRLLLLFLIVLTLSNPFEPFLFLVKDIGCMPLQALEGAYNGGFLALKLVQICLVPVVEIERVEAAVVQFPSSNDAVEKSISLEKMVM